jgi:hypothetical protein
MFHMVLILKKNFLYQKNVNRLVFVGETCDRYELNLSTLFRKQSLPKELDVSAGKSLTYQNYND